MRIIVDESVSYGVALTLKEAGHDVIAIADSPTSGIIDEDIFNLATLSVVPKAGVEPARPFDHQTLNLARLPVPPLRLRTKT